MPERGGANIEVARKLNEGEEGEAHRKSQWIERLEIVEAVVLATVAIATRLPVGTLGRSAGRAV